jgi:anti-sigma28 factor (negative regulator of flagellin synthesis)
MSETYPTENTLNRTVTALPEPPESGIRADRVAAARERLAAGAIPLSAGALAEAILNRAALARLCRD